MNMKIADHLKPIKSEIRTKYIEENTDNKEIEHKIISIKIFLCHRNKKENNMHNSITTL